MPYVVLVLLTEILNAIIEVALDSVTVLVGISSRCFVNGTLLSVVSDAEVLQELHHGWGVITVRSRGHGYTIDGAAGMVVGRPSLAPHALLPQGGLTYLSVFSRM